QEADEGGGGGMGAAGPDTHRRWKGAAEYSAPGDGGSGVRGRRRARFDSQGKGRGGERQDLYPRAEEPARLFEEFSRAVLADEGEGRGAQVRDYVPQEA